MSDLKTFTIFGERDNDYPEDVERIIRVLRERGFACTRLQARTLWEKYSDELASASWWIMDDLDDDQIFARVRDYMVVDDDT